MVLRRASASCSWCWCLVLFVAEAFLLVGSMRLLQRERSVRGVLASVLRPVAQPSWLALLLLCAGRSTSCRMRGDCRSNQRISERSLMRTSARSLENCGLGFEAQVVR